MDLANLPWWGVLTMFAVLLIVGLGSGMWIAFAMMAIGTFALAFTRGGMLGVGAHVLWSYINSFPLLACPLFIFMGEVILHSGVSRRLYKAASQWTSIIPGGLTHSNIVACSIFAAVSGSSVATAATIGLAAFPEQESRGYNRRLVLGSLAAGGTLGILIPPSITMIIYGVFVSESVPKLFIGGIIPGIMLAGLFMCWIMISAFIRPNWAPRRDKFTWAYIPKSIVALKDMWPFIAIILFVMGSIYLGFATATEAAAVSCTMALVVAAVYRRLNFQMLREATKGTIKVACMVMFLLAGAGVMSMAMSMLRLPGMLSSFIAGLEMHRMVIWAAIVVMYIILGCFIDGLSMMLLTLPVIYPLLTEVLGFDSVWFGIQMVILMEMAVITPPLGLNCFVIDGIAGGDSLTDVFIGVIPFFFCMVIALVILTAFPQLVLFLPGKMFAPRW